MSKPVELESVPRFGESVQLTSPVVFSSTALKGMAALPALALRVDGVRVSEAGVLGFVVSTQAARAKRQQTMSRYFMRGFLSDVKRKLEFLRLSYGVT
jgi:hypothetical protein